MNLQELTDTLILEVYMESKLEGKNVKVCIAFGASTLPRTVTGVVKKIDVIRGCYFLVFEDDSMVNINYIQTIEFI